MGRVSERVASSVASVSPCLIHYSLSLVPKFKDFPAAQLICLYCFPYMQFCVNPSQLQHITSLAHVFIIPVLYLLTARLLCASG